VCLNPSTSVLPLSTLLLISTLSKFALPTDNIATIEIGARVSSCARGFRHVRYMLQSQRSCVFWSTYTCSIKPHVHIDSRDQMWIQMFHVSLKERLKRQVLKYLHISTETMIHLCTCIQSVSRSSWLLLSDELAKYTPIVLVTYYANTYIYIRPGCPLRARIAMLIASCRYLVCVRMRVHSLTLESKWLPRCSVQ
jgi:hypothetical protein